MARTSIGSREVRDESVAREDLDTSTPGQSVITKILPGSDVSIAWTGADPGTGDVTVNFVGGAATSIPLDVYELADWYGGQEVTDTPITLNFDGPRTANSNYANVGGELEFLEAGPHLILARATASITSGSSRSESHMVLEENLGSGWQTIWGSEAFIYHRNSNQGKGTATSLITFNANVGDKLRIRLNRSGGTSTIETEDDGSNLIAVSLKGTRGDQGVTGSPGAPGTDGDDGLDGDDGSMIYTGAGAPSNSLGQDTDLYINTSNNEYYQKSSGTWGSPIGILGSGGSGVTAHDQLTGLTVGDDHPQYLNNARGDARYSLLNHTHTVASLGPELAGNIQKIETLHWMGVN